MAIAEIWREFIASEPYRFRSLIDQDGAGGLWIEQVKPIPELAGFLLGEFLYQLRAALDGLIYESSVLIHKTDPPPDEHLLMFPVYDDPTRFHKKTRYLAPFPKEVREAIESWQPYNMKTINPELTVVEGINRTLMFINDWARKDRHRRLHVVGSFVPSVTPKFEIPPPAKIVSLEVRKHVFLEKQTQVAKWKIDGFVIGMNVQTEPNLAVDIAIQDAPPPVAVNDSFGARITAMMAVADALVSYFEKTFPV